MLSISYGFIIEFPTNGKLQKQRIILYQHTIYTNDQLLDMFTGAMFIFSFVRFVNMCEPRTGWPTSIGILWKWASESAKLAGDGECRLTRFQLIRNFLANKIYLFQGCPIKQAVFLPGQPAPYNQLFIQPLLLVPECYSA